MYQDYHCFMLSTTDADHVSGFQSIEFGDFHYLVSILCSLLYQNFPEKNETIRVFIFCLLEVVMTAPPIHRTQCYYSSA